MRTPIGALLLAGALLAAPARAIAQCGSMSSHDSHGDAAAGERHDPTPPAVADEKAKGKARKFLNDPKTRAALLEVIFEDARFMRLLLTRLTEAPEWRALIFERRDPQNEAPDRARADEESEAESSGDEAAETPAFRCPMHPDVVAGEPGRCPKCGMDLERVPREPGK